MVGLNLDDSSQVFGEVESIRVYSGYIKSAKDAFDYMRRIRQGGEKAEEIGAYLVKLRRTPTIRERSNAMMNGIRFSIHFLDGGTVLAMRGEQVAEVATLPYVKWICPYLPEFKLEPGAVFDPKANDSAFNAYIQTFGSDLPTWRNDVARCGGTVNAHSGGLYIAKVDPDSVGCVTKLWWVLYVVPALEPVND